MWWNRFKKHTNLTVGSGWLLMVLAVYKGNGGGGNGCNGCVQLLRVANTRRGGVSVYFMPNCCSRVVNWVSIASMVAYASSRAACSASRLIDWVCGVCGGDWVSSMGSVYTTQVLHCMATDT